MRLHLITLLLLSIFFSCSQQENFYIPDDGSSLYSEDYEEDDFSKEDEGIQDYCGDREICLITETFSFKNEETLLDILFVVDVSQSMHSALGRLGKSMNSLLSHIEKFNWQMAFTTADHGDHRIVGGRVGNQKWKHYKGSDPHFGRFMNLEYSGSKLDEKILKRSMRYHRLIFQDTLTINQDRHCDLAPYCQGDHEQPLRVLKSAIERRDNPSFFRKDSTAIAILVTNEDERIEDNKKATTASEVKDTFYSVFPKSKDFYGFGIIVKDPACYNKIKKSGDIVEYGKRVGELAALTGGQNVDICETNYGPALRGISSLIRGRVLNNVYLKAAWPDPQSVQVTISPEQVVQWRVKGRHIVFNQPLNEGTQIEVSYYPKGDHQIPRDHNHAL